MEFSLLTNKSKIKLNYLNNYHIVNTFLKKLQSSRLSFNSIDMGIVASTGGRGFKCAKVHYPPI